MAEFPRAILSRLGRELRALVTKPPPGITYLEDYNEETGFQEIHVHLEGPEDTPYHNTIYHVKLSLPHDFPANPPHGYFLTRIYHPNVSPNAVSTAPSSSSSFSSPPGYAICVNTLKRDWHKDVTLSHVLSIIRCLLIVPFPESSLNDEAGKLFMESYEDYVKRAKLMANLHAIPKPISKKNNQGQKKESKESRRAHRKIANSNDSNNDKNNRESTKQIEEGKAVNGNLKRQRQGKSSGPAGQRSPKAMTTKISSTSRVAEVDKDNIVLIDEEKGEMEEKNLKNGEEKEKDKEVEKEKNLVPEINTKEDQEAVHDPTTTKTTILTGRGGKEGEGEEEKGEGTGETWNAISSSIHARSTSSSSSPNSHLSSPVNNDNITYNERLSQIESSTNVPTARIGSQKQEIKNKVSHQPTNDQNNYNTSNTKLAMQRSLKRKLYASDSGEAGIGDSGLSKKGSLYGNNRKREISRIGKGGHVCSYNQHGEPFLKKLKENQKKKSFKRL